MIKKELIGELNSTGKEMSIKDFRSQGGCPVRTFFGQGVGEILQMQTSALFSCKNYGFFKI